MSSTALFRWSGSALVPLGHGDLHEAAPATVLEVADSWLVTGGTAFALGLHRERFGRGIRERGFERLDPEPFWDAAVAAIPARGDWFPRVELVSRDGAPSLRFRLRSAPEPAVTVTLATHRGPDPRTAPRIKGPDLAAMVALRSRAQERGADEAVLLTADGYVSDGATTAIAWWRGPILCLPPEGSEREGTPQEGFDRVDSVTARSLLGLAAALGTETRREAVTPAELDGTEVWALNALHGIRIATGWVDGPSLAAEPGRLALWRARRDALRKLLEGPTT